jgi:hypothetical protein
MALLFSVSACGGTECLSVPCPQPHALEITVTAGATGAPIPAASIAVSGAATGGGPCQNAKCDVMGVAGTYEVDISAPGYQTVHRQVVVPGTVGAACGCPTAETQRLTVALPSVG